MKLFAKINNFKTFDTQIQIMPSAKTFLTTAASIAASAMVIRSITQDFIPYELQSHFFSSIKNLIKYFSSNMVLIVEANHRSISNQIYNAAEIYLGTKISPTTQMFKVSMPEKENKISTFMVKNQEILDRFQGAKFKWRQIIRAEEKTHVISPYKFMTSQEVRYFELIFHKKHKQMVLDSYFPFILKESKILSEENKTLKIHTLNSGHGSLWSSINLDHPASFVTLAMDLETKKMIMEDLERFVQRKEFYRGVGKAWKRGYLLYGPPGTGKSSLIAAMANYLKFDIYDLDLTDVHANSELRELLIATANQSILVVEDIDCGLELDDRQANQGQTVNIIQEDEPKVSLSGLLNFIDGLWASCGDGRIIVFTTNHKDRLDPALLRPGRMDVHIHMSYCTPCGFNTLAANYLKLNDKHHLFPEIKDLLEKVMATPAQIGEQLLKNEDPEVALKGLIEFLHGKKRESEELEARKLGGKDVGTENSVEETR